eukprot:UC1_evm1s39
MAESKAAATTTTTTTSVTNIGDAAADALAVDSPVLLPSNLRLVLGSESRWRRGLLERAGYIFEATKADIDEKAVTAGFDDRSRADARALTLAIAHAKADALLARSSSGSSGSSGQREDEEEKAKEGGGVNCDAQVPLPPTTTTAAAAAQAQAPALLITSDQVVVHAGRIREKPRDADQARKYLASYAHEPACTVTAVIVTNTATGRRVEGVDVAKQWFREIPSEVTEAVLAKGDIFYCAGGFMIDEPLLEPYLGKREGSEDSIIGMPLALLRRLLLEAVGDV